MMVFIVYCYICGNVMDVKDTKKGDIIFSCPKCGLKIKEE